MPEKDNLTNKTAQPSEKVTAEKKTTTKKTTAAKPATAKSTASKASTAKPATAKSTASKASTAKPATAKSTTSKASTAKPATAKSTTSKTSTAKSATAKSTTSKASTAKPATPKTAAAKKPAATKKPATVVQEEIKEEIKAEEVKPVEEVKAAEVKAEVAVAHNEPTEEVKAADKNETDNDAEERPVDENEIAASLDGQLTAIFAAKPEKRLRRADAGMTQEEIKTAQTEMHETYKEMSPLRLVARRFFRSRLSIVGLVMIVALFLFAYLGPVAYNRWGEGEIDTNATVTSTESVDVGNGTSFEEVYDYDRGINYYDGPSGDHLLGTDDKGMDVFTRLMYGGRISLMIGFIVVIMETLIGILLGGLAGYFGGWVDSIIMRLVDIFNCIPTLPILLIASAIIDGWIEKGAIRQEDQIYVLMVIITVFSWSGVARLVRGQILSLREQEFITATEVMGLPTWRRIFKHLIPNVMPQLIVSMTLGLGSVILYESTLSYLGLGVQLPHAAWGTMISLVNKEGVLENYPLVWLPAGLLIVVAVLGFNFVGDGLRDAMDPKAKK